MNETTNGRKRILVVDDESEALEYITDALEENYDVLTARSGKTALEILGSERIDLVLLDIAMKGMDGNEALREIRNMPGKENLPVCVVTALMSPGQEKKSRDLGANDYLIKPFRVEKLIDTVTGLLGD